MNMQELAKIIDNHKIWLADRTKGAEADLSWTNLSEANLCKVDLRGADLIGSNLSGANLSWADLSGANFRWADLRGANLSGASLSGANLSGANLSGCIGLIDPTSWMKSNFERSEKGYIVYKAFGDTTFSQDKFGEIGKCRTLTEVCNPNRTDQCGCGINFATLPWIEDFYRGDKVIIYKCLLSWEDLPGLIVPFSTYGKARCSKLKLIDSVQAK